MNASDVNKWWGEFELAENERRWWTLGPLLLGIERKQHEWRIGYEESADGNTGELQTNRSVDELESSSRFVCAHPGAGIRLTPALADRAVVTRPLSPLFVPPGESAVLFVSSPVWLRVEAIEPGLELADVPVARPSDTWLGPSTREGELCYASRTHGRLKLEDLPVQPYRVITPLEIVNESNFEIRLERVSLPAPNLSVYSSNAEGLWTQKVKMRCEDDARLAALRIKQRPPRQVPEAELVSPPRQAQSERVIRRALSSLFG